MAAGAAEREPEQRGTGGRDEIVELIVADLLADIGRALVALLRTDGAEAGGRLRADVPRGEFIAGELPADKLVVRQVGVEGVDDEVAVVIGLGLIIIVPVAIAVSV